MRRLAALALLLTFLTPRTVLTAPRLTTDADCAALFGGSIHCPDETVAHFWWDASIASCRVECLAIE